MTVTGSREALKPCPFCGGEATMECVGGEGWTRWSAGCSADEADCMGYQSLTTFARQGDAVKAWNTRASPDPAGVTLTLEEIARIVDPYFRDPLSLSLNKRRTDQALEKATAILSLIQKSVQPAHPPFNKGNE